MKLGATIQQTDLDQVQNPKVFARAIKIGYKPSIGAPKIQTFEQIERSIALQKQKQKGIFRSKDIQRLNDSMDLKEQFRDIFSNFRSLSLKEMVDDQQENYPDCTSTDEENKRAH